MGRGLIRLVSLLAFVFCANSPVVAFVPNTCSSIGNSNRRSSSSSTKTTSTRTELAAAKQENEGVTRRDVISAAAGLTVALGVVGAGGPAEAFGPIRVLLKNPTYEEVQCPPKQEVPGVKAGAGLRPVCVKVTVDAESPEKKDIIDAAVYGFVYDENSESVVANNPDGNTDAGQFAQVPIIPPGKSKVSFQFVAAVPPKQNFGDKKLDFQGLKAVSYPGGMRFKPPTECDMDPLAAGCEEYDVKSYSSK